MADGAKATNLYSSLCQIRSGGGQNSTHADEVTVMADRAPRATDVPPKVESVKNFDLHFSLPADSSRKAQVRAFWMAVQCARAVCGHYRGQRAVLQSVTYSERPVQIPG